MDRTSGRKFAIPQKNNGSFAKGENPNPTGRTPTTDPAGKAYGDSDFALKTNGRSVAKNMHLIKWVSKLCELGNQRKTMGKDAVHPPSNYGGGLLR